jgi:hypothetical protein
METVGDGTDIRLMTYDTCSHFKRTIKETS